MTTNHNRNNANEQRYIDIDGHQIPVNDEVYFAYKRPLWVEHKRKERAMRCRDENGKRCAKSCKTCQKIRAGSVLSLDQLIEAGYEPSDTIDVEELVAHKILLEQLFAALAELTSDERELVDDLFYHQVPERAMADKLGLSQKGINKRRHKVLEKLREKMLEK